MYTERHRLALAAFMALAPGCGHARAAAVLRAVHDGDLESAFALLDAAHSELAGDRAVLRQVRIALGDLDEPLPTDDASPLFVGDLARMIGVVPATIRTWERAGIVRPQRDRATGYRVYRAADVRDARMAEQLRRGGYGLSRIARLVEHVRAAGGVVPLRDTLDGWQQALTSGPRAPRGRRRPGRATRLRILGRAAASGRRALMTPENRLSRAHPSAIARSASRCDANAARPCAVSESQVRGRLPT
ncbi:hypothetical protein MTP03_12170 [Tsukamurella sp. PLM1]|nr:hypothetical protein MTP03_12170 [Tsukamurella sp. PLM1]